MYRLEIKSIDKAGTVEGWIERGRFDKLQTCVNRLGFLLSMEYRTLHKARILDDDKVIFKARFKLDRS